MIVLDLMQLGIMIKKVDRLIVELLAKRKALALQVEEYKRSKGDPIYRPEVEKERLDQAVIWANDYGLNPEFVRSVLHTIINESCKDQMRQLQEASSVDNQNVNEWRDNLLKLTARVAPTYDAFNKKISAATHSHFDFEMKLIKERIKTLDDKTLALDLGCANGSVAFYLSRTFEEARGLDISPDMIRVAESRKQKNGSDNVYFQIADIEERLPFLDNSVSFIAMTMGTASDLREINHVLFETQRVLKPGGEIFLSFYNANALIYRWDFIPWPASLAGQFNVVLNCLDVQLSPTEIYRIYAKLYKREEVEQIIPSGVDIIKVFSHPTFEALFPNDLLQEEVIVRESIEEADIALSDLELGAYLVLICKKSS